jgi:hypothetical protein
MTDLILAVMVVGAVITFGTLISVGNERQRRAIDTLHQAYKQWAIQDLRLKRGIVSNQMQIEDITVWLSKTTSLAFARKTIIMDYQLHTTPIATIEFQDAELGKTIIYTLEPPDALSLMLKKKRRILGGELRSNPIFQIGKKTRAVELSILNAGEMFDIELPVAWKALTGQVTESQTLWAYTLS